MAAALAVAGLAVAGLAAGAGAWPPVAAGCAGTGAASGAAPAGAGREVLFDAGPFVTHSGTGAGGANESWVQTSIGLTAYGFLHETGTVDEIADDFTIPEAWSWSIGSFTFFDYELYAPTSPSTITTLCFTVLDGVPDTPGTQIVFGDFYTNRLTSSVWTGCYRVHEGQSGNDDRPIMASTCVIEPALELPAGTYWIIWQTGGTQVHGPYAPPVTILGQADTGNALVTENGGLTFEPATDNGHPQGFPFVLEGTRTDTPVERRTWGRIKAAFR